VSIAKEEDSTRTAKANQIGGRKQWQRGPGKLRQQHHAALYSILSVAKEEDSTRTEVTKANQIGGRKQ
jgi:hypothetical protein